MDSVSYLLAPVGQEMVKEAGKDFNEKEKKSLLDEIHVLIAENKELKERLPLFPGQTTKSKHN